MKGKQTVAVIPKAKLSEMLGLKHQSGEKTAASKSIKVTKEEQQKQKKKKGRESSSEGCDEPLDDMKTRKKEDKDRDSDEDD